MIFMITYFKGPVGLGPIVFGVRGLLNLMVRNME